MAWQRSDLLGSKLACDVLPFSHQDWDTLEQHHKQTAAEDIALLRGLTEHNGLNVFLLIKCCVPEKKTMLYFDLWRIHIYLTLIERGTTASIAQFCFFLVQPQSICQKNLKN